MKRVTVVGGTEVSYTTYGSGPPLVLVHGGFSDHETNWQEVKALLEKRFSVYAVARRGRGESSATTGHSIADEAKDVVAVLRQIGEPACLLGHSYGAFCALEAAALYPAGVSKLVLYEPFDPRNLEPEMVERLTMLGELRDWDGLVQAFLLDVLLVPADEVSAIRESPFWEVWTADAAASLNDLRAIVRYRFGASRFQTLGMPVQLLIGTESPRHLYVTDALAAVLPNARIDALVGQAHEGMTTAPEQFVDVIGAFLMEARLAA